MDITLSGLPTSTAQTSVLTDGRRSAAGRPVDTENIEKAAPVQDGPATTESLQGAVTSIKDFVQTIRRDLNFDLDDSSGQMVVRVTDRATGEVVRQIPTEEALRLAENLEEARSLLFKAQA
ncbi:flagellar protein FlaG [Pseudomonas stutzeri]|uniref:Flagellar biosynthesis protein FlaG n=1 Tax=Stutzerimonas stutzeri TaxID=316 RepID=A0A2N8RZH5_STUST|nr:flagellar protein FlaG [Stutzerimonas stutzeri]MCQ4295094.1 flagellar protein FlaG [Stutzerimonas stutzeri]PNF79761.1 flagellar biosynthesis protein FlaG [Stutzerimonas stutzeri]